MDIPTDEFVPVHEGEIQVEDPIEEYFRSEVPEKIQSDSCNICKHTWESTSKYATTTRLCGHTFHTMCIQLVDYTADGSCQAADCNYKQWVYIHTLHKKREQLEVDKHDDLLEESFKSETFKSDFKVLKSNINNIRLTHSKVLKEYGAINKKIIHKHIHSINQIQRDLNEAHSAVKKMDVSISLKKSISAYRRHARTMFTNYHTSIRSLIGAKLIKVNYRLRWILERHGHVHKNTWRNTIRIKPGKGLWKDPINTVENV